MGVVLFDEEVDITDEDILRRFQASARIEEAWERVKSEPLIAPLRAEKTKKNKAS